MDSPLRRHVRPILASAFLLAGSVALAGFASNEVYLASIGRGGGASGAQFYSTLWVTNLSTSQTVHFTFFFLKDGQSNLTGDASFNDTLAPGQTKLYENVTETKLNLPGLFGAARITADGEIFASERVYNLAHSTDNLGTSEGLFFAAVPRSFAIGSGETASIQGVNQGSPTEDMRTNFDLVETTGNTCKVHVTLLDSNGTSQGATDVNMVPYGHVKLNAQALLHSINMINGRIVATVTSGSGKVILAGEQLGNTSQDSSGFEMSFKDSLLGSNSGGSCGVCVTSLNGLSGDITLAAGSNVTVNKSGQTITIASSGGGGGLTLPYSGTASSSQAAFGVTNSGSGDGVYGQSDSVSGAGVHGKSANDFGVYGEGTSATSTGVYGLSIGFGVYGVSTGDGAGVYGYSSGGNGASGVTADANHSGVRGEYLGSSGLTAHAGVWGDSNTDTGVAGTTSNEGAAVFGYAPNGTGVYGQSTIGYGVYANGGFGGTGAKYFVEPHPTDASKEIRYVCLEGPEAGTYFRGSARIVNGFASIEVPESFRMVTASNAITVQVTPVGGPAVLYCVGKSLDTIVIQGNADVEFDYLVNGIRKSFAGFQPISENKDFVPKSPHDDLGVAALPAESVRRLKASGILNADGSINLATVHRLGWDQRPAWSDEAKVEKESK